MVCVDQTDAELRERGIYGIGGWLSVSKELRILWSPPYFSPLGFLKGFLFFFPLGFHRHFLGCSRGSQGLEDYFSTRALVFLALSISGVCSLSASYANPCRQDVF